jgi:NAD(P)-dependent dehydrogenase (short-subunit alcohol dehydrogenase family)
MTQISGAVAVVTGGASGIGFGIAQALRDAGARVVIADIQQAALDRAATELGVDGIQVDVADAASVQSLADAVIARYGQVGIVVNNAGVGPAGDIEDLTLEDWRWILDVNLWGVIHGVHAFLPLLLANPDGGRIVNTASMSSFQPLPSLGAYAASKAAVHALSETLAAELARDGAKVGVTLLTPGPVLTGIATSQRNRPGGASGGLVDVDMASDPVRRAANVWLRPEDVGDIVVRAIRNDDFYAITHPVLLGRVETRHAGIVAAFDKYPQIVPPEEHNA